MSKRLIQDLHAGISRRDWNAVELAANRLRDDVEKTLAILAGTGIGSLPDDYPRSELSTAALTAAFAAMPGPAVKVKKHLRHRVTGFRGNPLRVVLSNGDEASVSQKLVDSFANPSPFDRHPDDLAVDRFAAAMKAKLAKKRADGFGGWDDPKQCHIDYLVSLLVEQIQERAVLDPVDIANLSMMIHERGETPDYGR